MFYSIDPGVHTCYVATWVDSLLQSVVSVAPRDLAIAGPGPVVVEIPQVYTRGKGDPNDLIDLAFAAGRAVGGRDFKAVRPRDWKGQVPKAIHNRRVKFALTPEELARLPAKMDHNLWDAIGIGLWHLGRL